MTPRHGLLLTGLFLVLLGLVGYVILKFRPELVLAGGWSNPAHQLWYERTGVPIGAGALVVLIWFISRLADHTAEWADRRRDARQRATHRPAEPDPPPPGPA